MDVCVYVDGFNLYYRRLQGTVYRWLNLGKLSELLAPAGANIKRIRYFTANVKPSPRHPNAPVRQQIYLRALATVPNLSIHRGTFQLQVKERPLAAPPHNLVKVLQYEEKGSDVNLGSYLLLDAFRQEFDLALVVSNDSDLKTPVRMVRKEFGRRLMVAMPGPESVMPRSSIPADAQTRVSVAKLKQSMFPDEMRDAVGTFHKPPNW